MDPQAPRAHTFDPQTKANVRRRTARTAHHCEGRNSDHCSPIAAGDAYLEVTLLPGQNRDADSAGRPVRQRHCLYCAALNDNDYLLHPIPDTQDNRYWDLDSQALSKGRRT